MEAAVAVDAVAPVEIPYARLADLNSDLSQDIEQAFGPGGLGILLINEVPNWVQLRARLLPLAARFASLPAEVKARYEDPASLYNFGWSHGKETLENGQRDEHKGSYYANPRCDEPTADPGLLSEFPGYCRPNIWPTADLAELEGAFKAVGGVIIDVGLLLAKHCDKYTSRAMAGGGRLHDIIADSPCPKGRLLHYFPAPPASSANNISNWCGWHTDHGSLTGLAAAMYLDADLKEVACPDPEAGLYIRTRAGRITRAVIPAAHIAYQVGEAWQIESDGKLCATPHCVVAPRSGRQSSPVSRNTFAVFMQPRWDHQTRQGITFGEFSERVLSKNYK